MKGAWKVLFSFEKGSKEIDGPVRRCFVDCSVFAIGNDFTADF